MRQRSITAEKQGLAEPFKGVTTDGRIAHGDLNALRDALEDPEGFRESTSLPDESFPC